MAEKISVCMAVYNGAAYLKPQMCSILSQLRTNDEVVVVDDASQDNSAELLRELSDARVHVYRNERNLGVLAAFERATRQAQGDILFLSDQDDIWLPGKVEKIIAAFSLNPEITLVASDAQVIDETGCVVADSFFEQRGHFSVGVLHNLIKNKYLGCTLAFRRSMLEYFLPIPRDVPMHDIWFGLINDIYGKTHFIDQPLIAYRRHENNVSPSVGASIVQKLVWRWRLAKNLLLHRIQYSLSRGRRYKP
jgi:glycosyltransferase involved in cell wall biosynthesis